jgi:endogenous inhibitor of DNA gyrase (YacG/DUF329 family)
VIGKCPICERARGERDENPAFPFCSERCRLADLGKWLGEEYRIPALEHDDADLEPPGDDERH